MTGFDAIKDIWGSITDAAGDAVGVSGKGVRGAIGAAGSAVLGGMKDQPSVNSQLETLNRGISSMAVEGSFKNKDAQGAPQSVSPEALESQWLNRLNRFAQIQSSTGVKPR